MLTDLPRLLAPASVEHFLAHYHAKTRMLLRASDRQRAAPLLPWSLIEDLISSDTLDKSRFSVIRDNHNLPGPLYRKPDSETLRAVALNELIAQGVSMVINDIHRMVPAIGCLMADIERRLACSVGFNAYLSFGRKSAFQRHWDAHDVLVLQVHGRKQWRFWPGPVPYPLSFDRKLIDPGAAPELEAVLEAGDLLFVPRGEIHVAEVVDEPSVHLTISLTPPRGVNFFEPLYNQARQDPLFRMDLFQSIDPQQLDLREAELKRRLHALVDELSLRQFLQADDLARAPLARVCLHAVLPAGDERLALNLLRRIPLPEAASAAAESVLVVGGDSYRLTPAALSCLAWLFEQATPTADQLYAGLSTRHPRDAIEAGLLRLLRYGLVTVLPRQPPAGTPA